MQQHLLNVAIRIDPCSDRDSTLSGPTVGCHTVRPQQKGGLEHSGDVLLQLLLALATGADSG